MMNGTRLAAGLLTVALLSVSVVLADGDIVAYLSPVDNSAGLADPDFPAGVQTYDIVVDVSGYCYDRDNDWQGAELRIVFNGAAVYHHPLGWGIHPPDPSLYADHPGLQFDTFVCTADDDLSDGAYQADQVWNWNESSHEFTVSWIDLMHTGNGTWFIGRVSLLPCRENSEQWYELCVTSDCTGTYPLCYGTLGPEPCESDLDLDGDVDLADLAILLSNYGSGTAGDLNCDGVTDLEDLALLLGDYGCQPE